MSELTAGIDTIAFQTACYVLPLDTLARARNVDPDKFHVGLGQYRMAVAPPCEDAVTLAAGAALRAIASVDPARIGLLLFATETSVDESKSAGIYVHSLLGLPARCRVIELKQACYSATAGLQLAMPFLQMHPDQTVLLVASDIARYGLGTPGESSQGCGAVAMVLSVNPRLLALEPACGVLTEDVMDFWRPAWSDTAFVEGKYSSRLYLAMLEKTWRQYLAVSGRRWEDHAAFCYHAPVPRLVEKAHHALARVSGHAGGCEKTAAGLQASLCYGRETGNSYTASLYVGLLSLLENAETDFSGQRIGFYSYGSGCVAEFFSAIVQPGYQAMLARNWHREMLMSRTVVDCAQYEAFSHFQLARDGSEQLLPAWETGTFRLAGMRDNRRIYEKSADSVRSLSELSSVVTTAS